jgi:hypothetical protein
MVFVASCSGVLAPSFRIGFGSLFRVTDTPQARLVKVPELARQRLAQMLAKFEITDSVIPPLAKGVPAYALHTVTGTARAHVIVPPAGEGSRCVFARAVCGLRSRVRACVPASLRVWCGACAAASAACCPCRPSSCFPCLGVA